MSNIKVKLKKGNVRKYLKSEDMQALVKHHADQIAARCGSEYEADTYVGTNRVNSMVKAKTVKAIKDNLKNNTILKAVY